MAARGPVDGAASAQFAGNVVGVARADKVNRLRSWLRVARERFHPKTYASFATALRELNIASESQAALPEVALRDTDPVRRFAAKRTLKTGRACEEFTKPALEDIAALLWRARFPEGREAHTAWVNSFEEALPVQLKQSWFEAVRTTSPAPALAKQGHQAVHEATEVTSEAPETTMPASTKRSRSASLQCPESSRSPVRRKRDTRVQTLPICVICQDVPARLKVSSLCGHFACEGCWRQWFTQCFECPVCRRRVRPTNLIRLRGWGDD